MVKGVQKVKKIRQGSDPDLTDLFKPPPRLQSPPQPREKEQDSDSGHTLIPSPPDSPAAARIRSKQTGAVIQAPLREAVGPDGGTMLIKIPFTSSDLESWRKSAKEFQSDPVRVTKHFQLILKQHNPDWSDVQILVDCLTEPEKQMVLKVARDLAADYCRVKGDDVKDYFPLQDPGWNPNRSAQLERLRAYQEWVLKGMERAVPRNINWSALYEIKQGPSETPSEFLVHLREVTRRSTPLDPGSEIGIQELVSLFLGQSAGDIRRKLQKLRGTEGRNLETLLEEAWRVFSNREEECKRGQRRMVAVVREVRERKFKREALEEDHCAFCKENGHWKRECTKLKRRGRKKGNGISG